MEYIIHPEIFRGGIKAFFTGKSPGIDLRRIAEIAGIKKEENIYLPRQEHTGEVIELESDMSIRTADAVITERKGIVLGVQTADCVPILIHAGNLIATVHAGWRGTAKGIIKTTIKKMLGHSKPEEILIAIGPAIRWRCYEVGGDVLDAVIKETGDGDYYIKTGGKTALDLPTANKFQAVSMGILEGNIWMSSECTYCYPDRFYSYRYSKGPTGRQGGFIGII